MTTNLDELVAEALAARDRAYAPYSKFVVGAAISAGGQVYAGANVENASYGACVCAERIATFTAVNAGHRTFDAIAIATSNSPPSAPCGICRQVLQEFAGDPASLRVVLVNPQGEREEFTLAELLPHGFGPGLS